MNGIKKIVLDTNAVIYLLSGKITQQEIEADEIIISFVTEIEYKVYDKFSEFEKNKFEMFKSRITTNYINKDAENLVNEIVNIRKKHKLKLPDAIIAATALTNHATLITNDREFSKIQTLKIRTF